MNIANTLTISRILMTPLFIYFFVQGSPNTAIVIYILSSFTDWYDGYYARKTNTVTRFGQFMDPLADKVLNLSAIWILNIQGYVFEWVAYIIIIRDISVTLLRLYALWKNQPIITSKFAQWKTFLHMFLTGFVFLQILLIDFLGVFILDISKSYTTIIGISWLVTAALSIYTCIDYVYDNKYHILQIWRLILKTLRLI